MSTTPSTPRTVRPPRHEPHPEGQVLFDAGVDRALQLAGIVRDEDLDAVADLVGDLSREELVALAVAAAALVDVDRPVSQLLEWTTPEHPYRPTTPIGGYASWSTPDLRRRHAEWERGVRGPRAESGERAYQAARAKHRREQLAAGAAEVAS